MTIVRNTQILSPLMPPPLFTRIIGSPAVMRSLVKHAQWRTIKLGSALDGEGLASAVR